MINELLSDYMPMYSFLMSSSLIPRKLKNQRQKRKQFRQSGMHK